MKYFLHDSSSFEDEKISILFMEFGYEGIGLFYTILEKLAKQEKPINTKVLKMQLKVGKKLEKCWSFLETLDLISSNNGETFNKRLLKFGESIDIKREKTSKRVSQFRENEKVIENVTRYSSVSNAPNITEHNNNSTKQNNKEHVDADRVPDFKEPVVKEKKENPPSKVPPKVSPSSLHEKLKQIILSMNEGYYWSGKDGKALNSIIKKIEFRLKSKNNRDPTEEEVVGSFSWMMKALPEWYQDKWDTCTLDSKFESIVKQILEARGKTGKTNGNDSGPVNRDRLAEVVERINERSAERRAGQHAT